MNNTGIADKAWRLFVIYVPYVWLALFFLAPFLIVFKISFADPIIGQPPFTPLLDWTKDGVDAIFVTFDNYRFLSEDNLYWMSYLKSVKIAAISTFWCLLIGFPMAYAISRARTTTRNIMLLLVILPFWTSFLLRVYAWMGMLSTHGLINNGLIWLGIVDQPLKLLYTDFAVYIGIVYAYLPFMILPLYASLEKLDMSVHEAAADLGATPSRVFMDITLCIIQPIGPLRNPQLPRLWQYGHSVKIISHGAR
jgi:putrescine transport system permease protein